MEREYNSSRNVLKHDDEAKVSEAFWREVVHTIVHIQNISVLREKYNKTPYELWKGKPAIVR